MRIRLEGEIQGEWQTQFLKPLFGTNSSATDSQRFLSREIFALTVASASIAILFALGYLLTGWNSENLKGDLLTIISVLSSIIFTIVFAVIRYGFGPRVQKKLEKPEQEPKRRREHTKNLSTEVYEKLLQLRRGIGEPVPYTMEFMVRQDNNTKIPVEKLRYLERGIAHLRSDESYQGVYRLWEKILAQKRRYNDGLHELREELKILIIQKMQEYLSSFHEHESAQSPAVQNYFYSRGLVDFVVDEITLSLNNNVKLDFQNFEKIRWHSIDGEWYQLEGLSFKDRYILLQSRHPLTNQDEEKLRQALLEIRNNAPIVDVFNDLINLERESFVTVLEFKKELRTLLEQIKDIEDNYIIRGKCELGY